jgi:hypothetical protein
MPLRVFKTQVICLAILMPPEKCQMSYDNIVPPEKLAKPTPLEGMGDLRGTIYDFAKAGDLVIYGDKVLHGSSNNLSSTPRPVVHFGLLHPEAKLLYYYLNNENREVTVYEVPYSFFFDW